MEKEEVDHDDNEDNYYTSMDYSPLDRQQHHQFMKQQQQPHEMGSSSISSVEAHDHVSTYNINQGLMVDYMFNNNNSTTTTTTTLQPPSLVIQQSNTSIAPASAGFLNGTNTASTSNFDRLSFAEVMQFADFGPKLASNQQQMISTSNKISSSDEETGGMDPVYFLKFPVLSDRLLQEDNSNDHQYLPPPLPVSNEIELQGNKFNGEEEEEDVEEAHYHHQQQQHGVDSHDDGNVNSSVVKCNRVLGGGNNEVMTLTTKNTNNNRRKRPRSVKTSEEVESQRMTHIAVERNRRKQMNEHLRVLRSLMPGSYVQRGDQASIIGGAIEFVRELEQLLQCLESQKRRKLFGSSTAENNNVQNRSLNDQSSASPSIMPVLPHQLQAVPAPHSLYPPPAFPNADLMNIKHGNNIDEFEVVPSGGLLQGGIREDAAENKSCLADVEVKVLGDDAMIKILSKRRPGQLLKTIAALEDLQFNILHTNITTIEQTVLYSFNVKVAAASETTRFSAEDIASSVQQIFSFIHASSNNITNI